MTASLVGVFTSKWVQIVVKYLFRDLVKRLLNDLDYLVADIRVHSLCEGD